MSSASGRCGGLLVRSTGPAQAPADRTGRATRLLESMAMSTRSSRVSMLMNCLSELVGRSPREIHSSCRVRVSSVSMASTSTPRRDTIPTRTAASSAMTPNSPSPPASVVLGEPVTSRRVVSVWVRFAAADPSNQ
ncbi:hypothetical protein BRC84_03360 [Halobacteriales archaeon QS_1_68_44]|nr:MAG: hypothetical protein BRC84_03360 [Halobacteriales archaeon QS_1_68_44]